MIPAPTGSGRARRPAHRPDARAPAPGTAGTPAAAASARRRRAPQRSRASTAARMTSTGAGTPGNQRSSAAAPCATSIPRPSAARRPAARMAWVHVVSPRAYTMSSATAAPGGGGQRERIAPDEAERRGIDHGRAAIGLGDGTPSPRAQSSSRRRRSAERLATTTEAPRSRAAPTAARAPPPVPITSHGPGGVSSSSRPPGGLDVGVVSHRRAVLAPEGIAGRRVVRRSAADDRPTPRRPPCAAP